MIRLITPLLAITLLFFTGSLFAQQAIFQKVKDQADKLEATKTISPFAKVITVDLDNLFLEEDLKEKTILNIEKTDLASLKNKDQGILKVEMQLDDETIELQLLKQDILSPAYQIAESNGKASTVVKADSGTHYWGIVKNQPNSLVSLSVFDDATAATIITEKDRYTLGKIAKSDYHILYKDADLNGENDFTCEVRTTFEDDIHKQVETHLQNQKNAVTGQCIDIHIEADYDLYQSFGSSVTEVVKYVNILMGQVAVMYANENINIQISFINVWTNTSPYNAASGDVSQMLTALVAQGWGQSNGTLVHLLTTAGSGGVAYLDVLCFNTLNCAVSNIRGGLSAVPIYSWDVNVVTHEIGHNLGSPHTHDCAWNGNNTPIDDCGYNYSNGADGCNGPTPAAGTVMSYCHLIANIGVDFSLGFGQQPGDLIRNKVNNANCLSTCVAPTPPTCTDGISNGNEIGIDCGGPDCPDCPLESCETIYFTDYPILSYDTQDNGPATISPNGAEIFMTGNAWKAIPYNITLSPVTMLSFEFKSTQQGEIHEIAFDTDLNLGRSLSLMLWGTQSNGGTFNNATYNGSGNWQTFTVDIGAQAIGTFNYLIFTADDDANAIGNSYFRNIKIWEDYNGNEVCEDVITCSNANLSIDFDGFPGQTSWDIVDANGNVIADSNGTYGNQNGNSTLNVSTGCLPDGCYTFTMYDDLNNGMCPFQSSAVGISTFVTPGTLIPIGTVVGTLTAVAQPNQCGEYELTNAAGDVLASGGGSFGAQESTTFCLNAGLLQRSAGEQKQDMFKLYPTLASDQIYLSFGKTENTLADIAIFNIAGKQMQVHENVAISNWSAFSLNVANFNEGAYLMKVSLSGKHYLKKFIKQ